MPRRPFTLCLCVVLLSAMTLTGCKSQYGEQKTTVNYYPQCYTPVAELRKDENSVGNSTAAGAAGGALLGALIGGLSTGKVEGALAGAVAGGAVGAVGGHAYGKSQAKKRDAQYLQAYAEQLGSEARTMDRATAAATVAMKCYDKEFKTAIAQYKAGSITRIELDERYKEIRSGLEETAFILKSTATTMAERDAEYQKALAEDYTNAQPKRRQSTPVRQQASAWKESRDNLVRTQAELESRLVAYENGYNSATL